MTTDTPILATGSNGGRGNPIKESSMRNVYQLSCQVFNISSTGKIMPQAVGIGLHTRFRNEAEGFAERAYHIFVLGSGDEKQGGEMSNIPRGHHNGFHGEKERKGLFT